MWIGSCKLSIVESYSLLYMTWKMGDRFSVFIAVEAIAIKKVPVLSALR